MKKDKSSTQKLNIYEEYINYYNKYQLKYGSKSIVLMQVGSFHEAYSTNEKGPNLFQLSDLLNIVCTRKDKNISIIDEKNPYMLGFPSVALSKFLKILIDNNYTVIIIDQVTPPPNPSREVTGVYSPSTFIDNISNDNKYLMTMYIEINNGINSKKSNISIGMCAIDSSTGNVNFYESHGSGLNDENESLEEAQRFYHYYRPIELLVYQINNSNNVEFDKDILKKIDIIPNQVMLTFSKINPNFTKIYYQNNLLKKIYPQCGIDNPIEYLDLQKYSYGLISMIASFDYIHQHNENLIKELKIPSYFDEHKYMILGNNAQYQLNIIDYYNWDKMDAKFQSLNAVINNCCTGMGKRLLKQRLCAPFTDKNIINNYYELTDKILKLGNCDVIRSYLKEIKDLDKLFRKLSIKFIQPYELYSIYESFLNIIKVIELLYNSDFKDDLTTIFNKKNIKKFNKTINEIENKFDVSKLKINNLIEVKESFYLKDIHPEIDTIEENIKNNFGLIDKIAKRLQQFDDSIILNIKHNDRDGYYLATTKLRGEKLKNIIDKFKGNIELNTNNLIDKNELKFTFQTTTCKITYSSLNNHSNEIEELYNQLNNIIKIKFYEDTLKWYNDNIIVFKDLINFISQIDYITNNAYTSVKYHYTKPKLIENENSTIIAKQIRHPIIERLIDFEYTPHDVNLNEDINGNLIYGVNSSGKSSLMKAVGICLIMAQCGLYIPSEEFEYSIFTSLYTRISGNDNLFKGQSSFIVEMNELRCILKKSNKNSLIIGDEICRGTEYLSANAIVASAIIKLSELKSKFLFATHLHDLIKIEKIKQLDSIKFFHLSVDKIDNELVFNRKMVEGTGEQIYGITIAKYILDDHDFINNAIEIKNELLEENNMSFKLVNDKKSNYNNELYMDECSICRSNKNLESHHINLQKDFLNSKNGLIHKDKIHILKDAKSNLIVLCNKCHDKLHKSELNINSKLKSTKGIAII